MKKILLICLFAVAGLSAEAQLLWKISGNGLKTPSYLFGTHHLIPIQFLDSIPGLYRSFNNCNIVVGEMVMSNVDATAKIRQAAIMPDKKTMKDLLTDENYKLVDVGLKSVLKMGLKELSIMNPSLILTLYEMELYKKQIKLTDDKQADSYFQLVAEEKGKKVVGLETVEQQIDVMFGNGTLNRQAEILVETIRQKDSLFTEMAQLTKLYKAGKLDALLSMAKRSGQVTDMTNEEFARMVDNRNTNWIKQLPTLLKQSSCFIAVGALHLPGKNGLIKQLEKAGYHVKPVE